ncbi:MAG: hypothetical protein APR54_11025 [Candidatus Cloacimonas sp. SDB]|nr:MAG: hypothetical protein APR54_11025 [Candidatus Cloacimonas sp. SDB]
MNTLESYYKEKLYPLQDGLLSFIKKSDLPFYLTGGTALSRHYFHHRYSDDLDLFLNNNKNFSSYTENLIKKISQNFSVDNNRFLKSENHIRLFIIEDNVELKVDFINDTAEHFGEFELDEIIGKVDNLRNILSNKITCLYRLDIKDIVDIWIISKHLKFKWDEIIREANIKQAGIDPLTINQILTTYPDNLLSKIKWIEIVDTKKFNQDVRKIAEDILMNRTNLLSQ